MQIARRLLSRQPLAGIAAGVAIMALAVLLWAIVARVYSFGTPDPSTTSSPVDPAPQTPTADLPPLSLAEAPIGVSEPRIWIDYIWRTNWTFDFGTVPSDAAVERDITIRNMGTALLVINDVMASCGCAAATVGDSELAPGEATSLRVIYNRRHDMTWGPFIQHRVRIKSNDPKTPVVEFTIQGKVAMP